MKRQENEIKRHTDTFLKAEEIRLSLFFQCYGCLLRNPKETTDILLEVKREGVEQVTGFESNTYLYVLQ